MAESKLIQAFSSGICDLSNNCVSSRCTCSTAGTKRKSTKELCSYCLNEIGNKDSKKSEVLPFPIKYHLYDMIGAAILVRVIRVSATTNSKGKYNNSGDSIIRINKEYKGIE